MKNVKTFEQITEGEVYSASSQAEKLNIILKALKTPEQIKKASELLYKQLRWSDIRALAEIAGVHDKVFKTKKH